jgi:hypothetical protein
VPPEDRVDEVCWQYDTGAHIVERARDRRTEAPLKRLGGIGDR